jgi:hypothetical protein
MKKRIALLFVTAIAAVLVMVPFGAGARPSPKPGPACVVVNGPRHFHLQIGYAPTGPDGCRQIP